MQMNCEFQATHLHRLRSHLRAQLITPPILMSSVETGLRSAFLFIPITKDYIKVTMKQRTPGVQAFKLAVRKAGLQISENGPTDHVAAMLAAHSV